ncbi:MAG: 2,3-bisphosphoglycerate-dependent phosphoglycerate mutase [Mariniflexile sp.]|jgi:2,3-bisphosphoglycerate-dependent phosphoglycerate mutase
MIMKQLFTLLVFSIITFLGFSQNEESSELTTYYFIRHAEKDRSDINNKNPHLTAVGKTRAQNWNSILKHITFDAVYSTDYYRTIETAQPTAKSNNLEVIMYNPSSIEIVDFLNETKGKTVLIVGHSNTTPMFVNKVIASEKHKDIDDNNNGNLYIITIINGKISDQVLTIN